jgi:predicted  nucleic acid-binding Zn-ribbon protein
MNDTLALYELQQVELELIGNKRRLKELNVALQDNQTVQAAKAALDDAEATLKPAKAEYNEIQHQIQTNESKREATEARLYSGNVKNPKELQEMQQEVDSLKKWRAEWEDRLLVAIVAMEDAQAIFDERQLAYDAALEEAAANNAELDTEKSTLEVRNIDLEKQRQEIAANIEKPLLEKYVALRRTKNNRAVSVMKDDTCTICGVTQIDSIARSVRASDEIVTCRNCGRILIDANS